MGGGAGGRGPATFRMGRDVFRCSMLGIEVHREGGPEPRGFIRWAEVAAFARSGAWQREKMRGLFASKSDKGK